MGIKLEGTRNGIYVHRGAEYLLLHEISSLDCNITFLNTMAASNIPYRHKSLSKTYDVKDSHGRTIRRNIPIQLEDFCEKLRPEDPIILAIGQDYEEIDTNFTVHFGSDVHLIAEAGLSLRDVSGPSPFLAVYCDKRPKYDFFMDFRQTDKNLRKILELVRECYGEGIKDFWKKVV